MKRFYTLFVILLTLTSYLNTAHPQVEFTPVSSRTLQVQDAIVAAVDGINAAADVTEAHVASITVLNLRNVGITTLNAGDFDGFTALTELKLHYNELSSLPDGIFDELTALTTLRLNDNAFSTLPDGIFDELTALTTLHLHDNALSALPNGIFNELTALTILRLDRNALSALPDGIFEGVTNLSRLKLNGNTVAPLPLTVSLEKVGEGEFKAKIPIGAPFHIQLSTNITNGSITGDTTSITIPTGHVESPTLTVTRSESTVDAVTVAINTLSVLPSRHHTGYTIVKSDDPPLEAIAAKALGGRTLQVQQAIVAALSDVNAAADVTETHLASITTLNLGNKGIGSLKAGDFDNLTALTTLGLSLNHLTSLPDGIFDDLTALTTLDLFLNRLTSLPAGIFDNLTALTKLSLELNGLSALPADVFDNNTALTILTLSGNPLSTLPDGIFENLTNLTELYLNNNNLRALPARVFKNLTQLIKVHVNSRVVYPLLVNVSLEKVAEGQFKATAHTGAPFNIVLPLNVTNGSISGGANSITISTGSLESDTLTVTRTADTEVAVTVDIGTLQIPPIGDPVNNRLHDGYSLAKSDDLPLEVIGAVQRAPILLQILLDLTTLQAQDPTILEAKLDALRAESNGSLKYIQSIAWLESVLANLHPEKTRLLANYPNPFNPETWIPYHLAKPSDVQITLYNAQGSIVRRLDLGHQPGGYYTGRSRAAHWDGRNHIGEPVASGTYFYQLQADNVSLLRKMVILK